MHVLLCTQNIIFDKITAILTAISDISLQYLLNLLRVMEEDGVRTDLGHGGITCVLQTQFSSLVCSRGKNGFPRKYLFETPLIKNT